MWEGLIFIAYALGKLLLFLAGALMFAAWLCLGELGILVKPILYLRHTKLLLNVIGFVGGMLMLLIIIL